VTDDCAAINYRHFDTYNTAGSYALISYISGIPQSTVLIGVTIDEAQQSLTQQAKDSLTSIGVNLNTLAYRGKATFVTQVGQPSASTAKVAPASGDSLRLIAVVKSVYMIFMQSKF
jgi:hypothetical protein